VCTWPVFYFWYNSIILAWLWAFIWVKCYALLMHPKLYLQDPCKFLSLFAFIYRWRSAGSWCVYKEWTLCGTWSSSWGHSSWAPPPTSEHSHVSSSLTNKTRCTYVYCGSCTCVWVCTHSRFVVALPVSYSGSRWAERYEAMSVLDHSSGWAKSLGTKAMSVLDHSSSLLFCFWVLLWTLNRLENEKLGKLGNTASGVICFLFCWDTNHWLHLALDSSAPKYPLLKQ